MSNTNKDAERVFRESGIEVDPEEMVEQIDIEELNDEAVKLAMDMVDNLANVYFDKTFMNEHPYMKKRIDATIESMRLLIKNRKTNEKLHDILLKSICSNPSNASLYRAQTQNAMALLSIQKQIDDTISGLNNMMRGYQLEFNFNQPISAEGGDDNDNTSIHRGSKSFIEEMKQKNTEQPVQSEILFETPENSIFASDDSDA